MACSYRNTSDRMAILRCIGPEEFFLERVAFPFELLTFQCPPSSEVKIWTHGIGGPELVDTANAADLLIEAQTEPTQFEVLQSSEEYAPGLLGGDMPWVAAG